MPSVLLWLANQISLLAPQRWFFGLRRRAFVAAGAKIHPGAKINVSVRMHQHNVQVGDSWIGPGAQFLPTTEAPIVIGDRCDIAPEVMFHCGSHELGGRHRRAGRGISSPITIGDGTWVGARATFLAGAAVGSGCMIAAGSVVVSAFGDDVMLAGVPAAVVRELQD
jgi:acetyltransferase-like isoleucine patch superfamily enzyme